MRSNYLKKEKQKQTKKQINITSKYSIQQTSLTIFQKKNKNKTRSQSTTCNVPIVSKNVYIKSLNSMFSLHK